MIKRESAKVNDEKAQSCAKHYISQD